MQATAEGGYAVDALRCEGCGVCAALCPHKAIDTAENHCGDWYVSDSRFGLMGATPSSSRGRRIPAASSACLKAEARRLAKEQGRETILCDGSPGVGCPVIASLSGAQLAVGVVEPTPSGRHDFGRIADLCRHFRIPLAVIINKADLNAEESAAITAQCAADGHTLLGTLPFDPLVTEVMVRRQALTESHNPLGDRLKDMWSALQDLRVSR